MRKSWLGKPGEDGGIVQLQRQSVCRSRVFSKNYMQGLGCDSISCILCRHQGCEEIRRGQTIECPLCLRQNIGFI